jgi:single-strand DNA-binding protein
LENGQQVIDFRVATNHWYKSKAGDPKERTDWHRIQAWGRTGAFCVENLQKGDSVQIIGSIRNDVVSHENSRRVISSIRVWEVNLLSRRNPDHSKPRQEAGPTNIVVANQPSAG